MIDLGEILKYLLLDYLVIVKLSWMNVFQMTNLSLIYEVYMKYRQEEIDTKHKGGLIELDRQGSICKILKQYQPNCSESFYLEFNILKKK